MSIQLSDRVNQVKPSPTMVINARAYELHMAGHNIINLSVGEPDFDTPAHIKQAAIEAIEQNFTHYTAVDGIAPLKGAIINKLSRDNDLDYRGDQILVSNGAKHSLYNLAQALLNPADEVLIPAPYWVSYPGITSLAGARPVILKTTIEQGLKITPEQLNAAITDKTRLLFLNCPSNPSGLVYTKQELRAFADVLSKHPHVIIATDDIYEYITWNKGRYINILNVAPELADRTVVVNGVAKGYAMTGWRIGYAAGPAPLIKAMKTIQSQSTSNPNSIAQKASIAALNTTREQLHYMYQAFERRHNMAYGIISQWKDVRCLPAEGAFYLFPDVSKVIAKLGLDSDIALAEHLLNEHHVATVPGIAFGLPGFLRISCSVADKLLTTALERIDPIFNSTNP